MKDAVKAITCRRQEGVDHSDGELDFKTLSHELGERCDLLYEVEIGFATCQIRLSNVGTLIAGHARLGTTMVPQRVFNEDA